MGVTSIIRALGLKEPCYFVADAYYANKIVITELLKSGKDHLISLVRSNAVAYYPAVPIKIVRRGAKRKYGRKIELRTLLRNVDSMQSAASPVYGERNVTIRYRTIDLWLSFLDGLDDPAAAHFWKSVSP